MVSFILVEEKLFFSFFFFWITETIVLARDL